MNRVRISSLSLAVGFAACLAGCASIDPGPFNQFATGLEGLRNGVDAQAAVDVQNARARFVGQVEAGKIIPPDLQLTLQNPDGTLPPFALAYGFASEEPLYIKLGRFQLALRSLNDAMISYARLLATLAADETMDPARFDTLTTDLNANASSAAKALNIQGSGDAVALLSTVAVKIFRAALERKRRQELTRVIAEVQTQVVKFSEAVQVAIKELGNGVFVDYVDKISPLINLPPPTSQATLDAILKLNDDTQQTMDTLGSLYNAYGRLPEAHENLEEAANKRPGELSGLLDFVDEGLRLRTLFTDMAAQNEAAAADAGG